VGKVKQGRNARRREAFLEASERLFIQSPVWTLAQIHSELCENGQFRKYSTISVGLILGELVRAGKLIKTNKWSPRSIEYEYKRQFK
jgi:hypothetical protein